MEIGEGGKESGRRKGQKEDVKGKASNEPCKIMLENRRGQLNRVNQYLVVKKKQTKSKKPQ